ncbi:hypothetical protein [Paenibacillus sp. YPG26]|uniref:hypothetical protein n=1 Tax=Paenibacillus sp. YPG26 TaxID=2878915 RepID=UPI0020417765|nr:hypothetical protein [Paenibacillus sp. YPG26]USB34349.1 hypothetical protein LDO05_06105 [Paenibacillus sp. YPG26]
MDKKVELYFELKQQHKEIEQRLAELRREITGYLGEHNFTELDIGGYKVKLVQQERKEYDENKLYQALPDPELWRLASRPDTTKISSLLKLNVLSETQLQDTYSVKPITLLHVEKK